MDEIDLGEVSRRLAREGAQRGDVQVSLAWNTLDDLDIRVVTPSGETISYQNKQSRCGGHLDVDMNANGRCSIAPVENVYWSRAPNRPTSCQATKTHKNANFFSGQLFGSHRRTVHAMRFCGKRFVTPLQHCKQCLNRGGMGISQMRSS